MRFSPCRSSARGFTLIELLVAIGVSVVLLSILAFVFRISTAATRDAASRVSLTERMRSLNIRMRQEVGNMLPIQRLDSTGKPFADGRTFWIGSQKRSLEFASATVEGNRAISVDLKYEFIEDPGGDPRKNVLVRWRDKTGPLTYNYTMKTWEINPNYRLGDDQWETPTNGDPFAACDVMVSNCRAVEFDATEMDVPAGMPFDADHGATTTPSPTDLNPRQLPAAIKLTIRFGPETGNLDVLEQAVLYFPVYRGL